MRLQALRAQIASKAASLGPRLTNTVTQAAVVADPSAKLIQEQIKQQHESMLERERSLNLIIDSEGRTIDKRTGEVVQIESRLPTLKANLKAQKRDYKTAMGTAASGAIIPEKQGRISGTATDLFASGISSTMSTTSTISQSSFLKPKLTPSAATTTTTTAATTSTEGQSELFFDPRLK